MMMRVDDDMHYSMQWVAFHLAMITWLVLSSIVVALPQVISSHKLAKLLDANKFHITWEYYTLELFLRLTSNVSITKHDLLLKLVF